MDKNEVLYEQCDVLVPAAIGNVITSDNASKLNCQYVVEAANGPTTPNVGLLHAKTFKAMHTFVMSSAEGEFIRNLSLCDLRCGKWRPSLCAKHEGVEQQRVAAVWSAVATATESAQKVPSD